ncbi:Ubiquitin-conjugating enzyme E2 H [Thelohanellus kitauei]|uniref:Ubiquitin-conjugating enzyme E2 H n=1 Tax=Thelohanellus kitauei TaxID=669202 RepID=A0A0C2J7P5_THEKT|nr:Ubiquitin-conjugating enzyme E2 H [Thelohanellus kitauei]
MGGTIRYNKYNRDLSNIFETFLPHLLRYPNPDDPLNHVAAALYKKSIEEFKKCVTSKILTVKEHIQQYATEDKIRLDQLKIIKSQEKFDGIKNEHESSLSSLSDYEALGV